MYFEEKNSAIVPSYFTRIFDIRQWSRKSFTEPFKPVYTDEKNFLANLFQSNIYGVFANIFETHCQNNPIIVGVFYNSVLTRLLTHGHWSVGEGGDFEQSLSGKD